MNSTKFCSRKYEVPLANLFPAIEVREQSPTSLRSNLPGDDTSSDEDDVYVPDEELSCESDYDEEGESEGSEDAQDVGPRPSPGRRPAPPITRPVRNRQPPARYGGPEWVRH